MVWRQRHSIEHHSTVAEPSSVAVSVEPEQPDDAAAVRVVHLAAFTDEPQVADLVDALRLAPEYVRQLSLVARHEDQVVGHVMLTHADLVPDVGPVHRTLVLSPLGVLPSVQGRGVGTALVRAALTRADALLEPLVVLQGSPRYYSRFGFRDSRTMGISMELPDWAPPEAGQAVALSAYSPDVTGHLRLPPAFDVLP
jgi:putative acetyltransferase